ncbi:MAG: HigA family addiction module antitoxin, partial [Pseudomonadota bacterium]
MTSSPENEYTPDDVSPPGETIQETLDALGMTQTQLATRSGHPKKVINQIIKGKAAITPDTALHLERVLGVPASFWNERERHYREFLAAKDEAERLSRHEQWLRELPIAAMARLGWIRRFRNRVQQIRELLNYFGIASPGQWDDFVLTRGVQFRQSTQRTIDKAAVAVWLYAGELAARKMPTATYDEAAFRRAVTNIRALTLKPPGEFMGELEQMCKDAGVAVVFVHEFPRTGISGATRWPTPGRALIQLSLRYKTSDQLWFTFFHEAGHIILHGRREVFLEGLRDVAHSKKEKEKE